MPPKKSSRRQQQKKKAQSFICTQNPIVKWFDDLVPRPSYGVHPQIARFEETSCGCLGRHNPFRRLAILLVVQPEFDQLVFCIIVYNTVLLGFADYSNIYTDNKDGRLGELNPNGSLSNAVLLGSEWPLAFIYAAEAFLKIVAMGFHVYIKEYWNQLDLVVSLAGVLQVMVEVFYSAGGGASLAFLRTFRVLRPLRSLGHFSGMRVVVDAMMEAIPRLVAVIVLVLFSFVLFGIMGVYLFNGQMSSRCRLTPFPVTLNWTVNDDYNQFRCLDDETINSLTTHPNWYKRDSPWYKAQPCFWPIDEEDTRVCSHTSAGMHQCYHNTRYVNESDWRWCGSNFDAYGNPRFRGGEYIPYYGEKVGQRRLMGKGVYEPDMNWGMTNFDDFPSAVITIFQMVTLEGWSNIMYMAMDGAGPGWSLFFCTIVFVGSFFVLNLVLAVLENSFTMSRDKDLASILHHQLKETKAQPLVNKLTAPLILERMESHGNLSKKQFEDLEDTEEAHLKDDHDVMLNRRTTMKQEILLSKKSSFAEIVDMNIKASKTKFNPTKVSNKDIFDEIGKSSFNVTAGMSKNSFVQSTFNLFGSSNASVDSNGDGTGNGRNSFVKSTFNLFGSSNASVDSNGDGTGNGSKEMLDDDGQKNGQDTESSTATATATPAIRPGLNLLKFKTAQSMKETSDGSGGLGESGLDSGSPRGGLGGSSSPPPTMSRLSSFTNLSPVAMLRKGRGRKGRSMRITSNRKSYFVVTQEFLVAIVFHFWHLIEQWWGKPPTAEWRIYVKEKILESKYFDITVLAIILLNTATLITDRWPVTHLETYVLDICNFFLTSLFTVEMLLKMAGLGTYAYVTDLVNLIDGLIVVSSIIEYCVSPPEFLTGRQGVNETGAISALRCFRLFRVFKLSKEWKSMHELLDKFVKTFWDVSNVAFIFLLLTYIFTLLGMQLFANILKFDDEGYPIKINSPLWRQTESPRANFDTILWSFVTIFQILTAENWNDVMYSCRRSLGAGAVVFFFFLIIVGMFIILNLFLAILLSNFSAKEVARVKAMKAVEEAEAAIKEENLKQLIKLQEDQLKEKLVITRADSSESIDKDMIEYDDLEVDAYLKTLPSYQKLQEKQSSNFDYLYFNDHGEIVNSKVARHGGDDLSDESGSIDENENEHIEEYFKQYEAREIERAKATHKRMKSMRIRANSGGTGTIGGDTVQSSSGNTTSSGNTSGGGGSKNKSKNKRGRVKGGAPSVLMTDQEVNCDASMDSINQRNMFMQVEEASSVNNVVILSPSHDVKLDIRSKSFDEDMVEKGQVCEVETCADRSEDTDGGAPSEDTKGGAPSEDVSDIQEEKKREMDDNEERKFNEVNNPSTSSYSANMSTKLLPLPLKTPYEVSDESDNEEEVETNHKSSLSTTPTLTASPSVTPTHRNIPNSPSGKGRLSNFFNSGRLSSASPDNINGVGSNSLGRDASRSRSRRSRSDGSESRSFQRINDESSGGVSYHHNPHMNENIRRWAERNKHPSGSSERPNNRNRFGLWGRSSMQNDRAGGSGGGGAILSSTRARGNGYDFEGDLDENHPFDRTGRGANDFASVVLLAFSRMRGYDLQQSFHEKTPVQEHIYESEEDRQKKLQLMQEEEELRLAREKEEGFGRPSVMQKSSTHYSRFSFNSLPSFSSITVSNTSHSGGVGQSSHTGTSSDGGLIGNRDNLDLYADINTIIHRTDNLEQGGQIYGEGGGGAGTMVVQEGQPFLSRASSSESEDLDIETILKTYTFPKPLNDLDDAPSSKGEDADLVEDLSKINKVKHVFKRGGSVNNNGTNRPLLGTRNLSSMFEDLFFGGDSDSDFSSDDENDLDENIQNMMSELAGNEELKNSDEAKAALELKLKARRIRDYDRIFPLEDTKSFFLFGPKNKFRLLCANIASTQRFEKLTILMIFASSITLAFDSPFFNPNSLEYRTLNALDIIFSVYFFFEVVIKSTCNGLLYGSDRAYLRDGFNCLDFVVVISGLWTLIDDAVPSSGSFTALNSIRSLRALRTLRPLRIIKRLENLKLVVNSIVNVVPDVVNVLVLSLLFYTMFGIIFVQYLKGTFRGCGGKGLDEQFAANEDYADLLYHPKPWNKLSSDLQAWIGVCNTSSTNSQGVLVYEQRPCCNEWPTGLNEKPTSREVCNCKEGKWAPTVDQNFDNIFNAVFTQFELSTTEGWVTIMHACVDAVGIDMQPIRDYSPGWALFMLVFMLIGNFFFINLFVGVLYERFTEMQKELKGRSNFLTKKQSDLVETQRLGLNFKPKKRPKPPKDMLGRLLFPIVSSPKFETFISVCISINTFAMAMTYFGMSGQYQQFIDNVNYTFAVVFFLECLVKLSAFKADTYFQDNWNRYDFVVAVGTAVALLIRFTVKKSNSQGVFIFLLYSFRLARILRLVRRAKALREIFGTLYYTGLGLINVFGLLFLLLYIYTVMGVQLFARVQYYGELNEHSNFRNFGLAMLTLFRCSTGENWNALMYDTAKRQPGCVDVPEYDHKMCGFSDRPGCEPLNGCGSDLIYVFLYSFTILVTVVALNLFVGVILSGFAQAGQSGHLLAPENFKHFQDIWMEYDEDATHYMDAIRMMHMLQSIEEPWGFGKEYKANERELITRIERLNLPIYNPPPGKSNRAQVYYYDVFLALTEFASMRAIRKNTDKFGGYFGVNNASSAMSKITAAAARAIDDASKHPHSAVLMKNIIEMSREAASAAQDFDIETTGQKVRDFEADLQKYSHVTKQLSAVKDVEVAKHLADRNNIPILSTHRSQSSMKEENQQQPRLERINSSVSNASSSGKRSRSSRSRQTPKRNDDQFGGDFSMLLPPPPPQPPSLSKHASTGHSTVSVASSRHSHHSRERGLGGVSLDASPTLSSHKKAASFSGPATTSASILPQDATSSPPRSSRRKHKHHHHHHHHRTPKNQSKANNGGGEEESVGLTRSHSDTGGETSFSETEDTNNQPRPLSQSRHRQHKNNSMTASFNSVVSEQSRYTNDGDVSVYSHSESEDDEGSNVRFLKLHSRSSTSFNSANGKRGKRDKSPTISTAQIPSSSKRKVMYGKQQHSSASDSMSETNPAFSSSAATMVHKDSLNNSSSHSLNRDSGSRSGSENFEKENHDASSLPNYLSASNLLKNEFDREYETEKKLKMEKLAKLEEKKAIKAVEMLELDDDDDIGGSSNFDSDMSFHSEDLDDTANAEYESSYSSSYTSSSYSQSQESENQWKAFTDLAGEDHAEMKRIKRMVAKMRTRAPLMDYWRRHVYTVREDFMARLIQRKFLRKIRGRAFNSYFDPDGAAGLNTGQSINSRTESENENEERPMILTQHVVSGTDVKYMVKMGGGMPQAYFKQLREFQMKNPSSDNFEAIEVPKPKRTNLFIDIGDVADALIFNDGSIESTTAMLERRGSTDIQESILSTRKSIHSLDSTGDELSMAPSPKNGDKKFSSNAQNSSRFNSVRISKRGLEGGASAGGGGGVSFGGCGGGGGVSFAVGGGGSGVSFAGGVEKEKKGVNFVKFEPSSNSEIQKEVESSVKRNNKKKKSVSMAPLSTGQDLLYEL